MWRPQSRCRACSPGCCTRRPVCQIVRCPGSAKMNSGIHKPSWRMSQSPLLTAWTRAEIWSWQAPPSSSQAQLYSPQGRSPNCKVSFLSHHSHFEKLFESRASFYCSPPRPASAPLVLHWGHQPDPKIEERKSKNKKIKVDLFWLLQICHGLVMVVKTWIEAKKTWLAKEEMMITKRICISVGSLSELHWLIRYFSNVWVGRAKNVHRIRTGRVVKNICM